MEKRYMDTDEVAEYLGVSKWTIYRLVSVRRIPFIPVASGKDKRFDIKAIDAWMEKNAIRAQAS